MLFDQSEVRRALSMVRSDFAALQSAISKRGETLQHCEALLQMCRACLQRRREAWQKLGALMQRRKKVDEVEASMVRERDSQSWSDETVRRAAKHQSRTRREAAEARSTSAEIEREDNQLQQV